MGYEISLGEIKHLKTMAGYVWDMFSISQTSTNHLLEISSGLEAPCERSVKWMAWPNGWSFFGGVILGRGRNLNFEPFGFDWKCTKYQVAYHHVPNDFILISGSRLNQACFMSLNQLESRSSKKPHNSPWWNQSWQQVLRWFLKQLVPSLSFIWNLVIFGSIVSG